MALYHCTVVLILFVHRTSIYCDSQVLKKDKLLTLISSKYYADVVLVGHQCEYSITMYSSAVWHCTSLCIIVISTLW